jgi:hypothetical protein
MTVRLRDEVSGGNKMTTNRVHGMLRERDGALQSLATSLLHLHAHSVHRRHRRVSLASLRRRHASAGGCTGAAAPRCAAACTSRRRVSLRSVHRRQLVDDLVLGVVDGAVGCQCSARRVVGLCCGRARGSASHAVVVASFASLAARPVALQTHARNGYM